MNKIFTAAIIALLLGMASCSPSQNDSKKSGETASAPKVYDEDVNPLTQIDEALSKAQGEGKFVVCQVGGNWCPWCLRFAQFAKDDADISKTIADNFVYIHVTFNPRSTQSEEKTALAKEMMHRLGNPRRFGFPVFVVLDAEGRVLHTQDSSFLEEGEGYDKEKVLRFFQCWTPEAVKEAQKE